MLALQKGLVPGMWFQVSRPPAAVQRRPHVCALADPGWAAQLVMNGTRIGAFGTVQRLYGAKREGASFPFLRSLLAGATSGGIGAVFGSPFFLVKVRQQTHSTHTPVGHQHELKGMVESLRAIYRADGVRGLWRGVDGAVPRTMVGCPAGRRLGYGRLGSTLAQVGGGTQMATYDHVKHYLERTSHLKGIQLHFAASMVAGVAVTLGARGCASIGRAAS